MEKIQLKKDQKKKKREREKNKPIGQFEQQNK